MTTSHEQENQFAFVDADRLEKAQNIITMIKEHNHFTTEETNEIIQSIYEHIGFGSNESQ